MSARGDNVLDSVMLERLAVIAAAHDRSVVEELNRAVATYVLNEISAHGNLRSLEEACIDRVGTEQR
jgi:dsRNA-specific ribonuclease